MTQDRTLAQAQDLAARLPPLLTAAQRVAASVSVGSHGRRRPGQGESFWQYRHAQAGDSAAAIDWRRSARGPDLFVRETEWSAAQSLWLWTDPSASMAWRSGPDLPTKAQRARLLTLALAALLLRVGERVAALDGDGPPSSGPGTLPRLAHHLLSAESQTQAQTARLPRPPHLPQRAEVVLVSDFLMDPDQIEAEIAALAAHGNGGHLLQVLDPAEESLPFRGRVLFRGLENEGEILARRAQDWRDDYRLRLGRHRDALSAIAAARGWSFATHRTDQPPQLALLAVQARLALPRRSGWA